MIVDRCPWYIAGPLLGLMIVGLRALLNKPFGALGGYVDLADNVLTPRRLGFRAFLLLGIVGGGVLYATTLGTFGYSSIGENAAAQAGILLTAGVVMGFGARTAGGCTSGHGMTGMSLGSPASIASSMTFFATAVGLAQLLSWFGGQP